MLSVQKVSKYLLLEWYKMTISIFILKITTERKDKVDVRQNAGGINMITEY